MSSADNSFRYSLTEGGDIENKDRGSNITYLTARNEGSIYGQQMREHSPTPSPAKAFGKKVDPSTLTASADKKEID
jgi:hypothetical protein